MLRPLIWAGNFPDLETAAAISYSATAPNAPIFASASVEHLCSSKADHRGTRERLLAQSHLPRHNVRPAASHLNRLYLSSHRTAKDSVGYCWGVAGLKWPIDPPRKLTSELLLLGLLAVSQKLAREDDALGTAAESPFGWKLVALLGSYGLDPKVDIPTIRVQEVSQGGKHYRYHQRGSTRRPP